MNRVTRLPGRDCLYYRQGCCLREEYRNPMLRRDWRCRILTRWEKAHDDFIDRAERFNLPEAETGALWERVLLSLQGDYSQCEMYETGVDQEEAINCQHFLGGLCLKMLPPCNGICREFTPLSVSE